MDHEGEYYTLFWWFCFFYSLLSYGVVMKRHFQFKLKYYDLSWKNENLEKSNKNIDFCGDLNVACHNE